ncbi:MAG: ABC transporter ATP-binding protein [Spirochaetaceae bacterium]|jgi:ABC-2 type transport system ATP-binding protein|nr:ABC transporter ATP-binding protein [Spirochaetaceae bacterium]
MLAVNGLTKYYGERMAINNITFTVPDGQILGLLGLNGAGKSTTMNILAGCLSSSSGTVLVDGIDIEKEPEKAKSRIGYLPEIPPLYPDMRVAEYLDFVFELKKIRPRRKNRLEDICRETGLEQARKRLIANLSKGYRQRVGLAAALAGDPAILVLDEPTVGLDPTQIIEIRNLISRLGKERTVIFSSHILSEVQILCSRVLVLDRGQAAADEKTEDLVSALENHSSYVVVAEGEPGGVLAALKNADGVREARMLRRESENVREYFVAGEKRQDIRKAVFRALSGGGFALLNTKQNNSAFEQAFLSLINAETIAGGEDSDREAGYARGF